MLVNYIVSVITLSIIFTSMPMISLTHIQDNSNAVRLYILLQYEQLNAFFTQSKTRIIPDTSQLIISKASNESSLMSSCEFISNRQWFGFNESLTSMIAGSIEISCAIKDYRISFPVGKSLIRLYK